MNSDFKKNYFTYKQFTYESLMYKQDLALKNHLVLICHKPQPNQILYI